MSTPAAALLIARLDLRRRLRDRSILLQVFLAPIVIALIVGGAFGGGSGSLEATVLIADDDRTPASQGIGRAIAAQSEPGGVEFVVEPATRAQADVGIDFGGLDALLNLFD